MVKPLEKGEGRADSKRRRHREVEERLAAFGLARVPRRVPRGARPADSGEERARALGAALESLGPVFSSFGRYLSTRVDLLPARDCLELAAIGDRAAPSTPADARALVARELGRPPAEAFRAFEFEPFDSRLLFQLHRATLADGRPVVVKLVPPEVEERVLLDADALSLLGRVLAPACGSPAAAEGAVEDFRRALLEQTDLTREAAALEALARDAEEFGLLRVPNVQGSHSTSRMLTTERLPGLGLEELAATLAAGEGGGEGAAAGEGVGVDVARRLCVAWLRQALGGGLFPVEPSAAGNVLLLPQKQIAFTGGAFASLPPESRDNLLDYLIAAQARDPDRACACLLRELRDEGPGGGGDALRQRFRQVVPARDSGWVLTGDGLAEHLFVQWRLAGEHGFVPLPHTVAFFRGLFMTAIAARWFDPHGEALADALRDLRLITTFERFRSLGSARQLGERVDSYAAMLLELPQRFDEVLTLAAEGRAQLKVGEREAVGRRRRKNSAAAVASLLLLLAAFVLLAERFGGAFGGPWAEGVGAVGFIAIGGLLLRAATRD